MCAQAKNVVFVFGLNGAGKTSLCARFDKEYPNVHHVSVGQMLREERDNPRSVYGSIIDKCFKAGQFAPSQITCALIKNAIQLKSSADGQSLFLIDGFPRLKENLNEWHVQMAAEPVCLKSVLVLHCPEHICLRRCSERFDGRNEDQNVQDCRERIAYFKEHTAPVIECLKASPLVFHEIDASQSPEQVYANVQTKLFS